MTQTNSMSGWTTTMRWIARLVGIVAVGLFVAFLAMSGMSVLSALSLSNPQGIPLLIALVLALAGVIVAWRWELVGGIMTMVGAAAIIGLVCFGSGADMFLCSLFFTLPLLVSGLLYLICCYRTKSPIAASQA